jgi:thiol-disulfide isomerase/thioredoxin
MIRSWTQRTVFTMAAGALSLVISSGAAAQDASQTAAPSPAQSSALSSAQQQPTAQADSSAQPDQPTSLGDLARLARAKKQTDAKATKVYDEDNLPRGGGISVVGSSGGGDSAGSRSNKMVLLGFWASWCGPCRESVPDLKQLQKTYRSDQLEVISVNEDDEEKTGRAFATANQMNWEQQFDSGGEMAKQYGVHAFPTYILTDSSGKVLQRFEGEEPGQPLANRIGSYLNKTPAEKT